MGSLIDTIAHQNTTFAAIEFVLRIASNPPRNSTTLFNPSRCISNARMFPRSCSIAARLAIATNVPSFTPSGVKIRACRSERH